MASGTVTEAVEDGEKIRITVTVDEGPVGMVPYTARIAIADLRALPNQAARKTALLNAIIAVRDDELQRETQIDVFLASLNGATVTIP